jgi:hypothetical protein
VIDLANREEVLARTLEVEEVEHWAGCEIDLAATMTVEARIERFGFNHVSELKA